MEQYIPKSALVAEIEKTRKALNLNLRHDQGVCDGLYAIQKYINSLEVKEMDFEREMQAFAKIYLEPLVISDSNIGVSITMSQLYGCAKHFFELGLKVSNKSIDITPNIDVLLKEQGIDIYSREAKVFKEVFYKAIDNYLSKAQKGEEV